MEGGRADGWKAVWLMAGRLWSWWLQGYVSACCKAVSLPSVRLRICLLLGRDFDL
jgi:hypothetical protein